MSSTEKTTGFFKQSQLVRTPNNKGQDTILPISRSNWIKGIEEGRFPRPAYMGGIKVWKKSVIYDLLDGIANGEYETEFSASSATTKNTASK